MRNVEGWQPRVEYLPQSKNKNNDQKSQLFGRVGRVRTRQNQPKDGFCSWHWGFGRGNPTPTCLSAPNRLKKPVSPLLIGWKNPEVRWGKSAHFPQILRWLRTSFTKADPRNYYPAKVVELEPLAYRGGKMKLFSRFTIGVCCDYIIHNVLYQNFVIKKYFIFYKVLNAKKLIG